MVPNRRGLSGVPAILFAGATILIGAGCGSHMSGTGGALSDCELKLENNAAAVVLKRDHDAGQLGKANVVAAHFKGDESSTYLEADGKLLLLANVTHQQTQIDYAGWMASFEGDAGSRVGDEMFAARMKARGASTCKSKTR